MNILPFQQQIAAISCLTEGMSIRATERMTGIHRDTIMRLGKRVGDACTTLHDVRMRNVRPSRIQIDELWSFIGKKQKRLKGDDWEKGLGDLYTFIAMDQTNKAIITYATGIRDSFAAGLLIRDLRARVLGAPMISTDAYAAYPPLIAEHFGDQCQYGTVIKKVAGEPPVDAARRYSPGAVVEVHREAVIGNPTLDMICTSHVERLNLSVRMGSRRFGRLTNAHSKKRSNHRAAVALFAAHYNYVRVHETLRTTPAVAIGITERPWSIGELVETAYSTPQIPAARQNGRFRVIDGGLA